MNFFLRQVQTQRHIDVKISFHAKSYCKPMLCKTTNSKGKIIRCDCIERACNLSGKGRYSFHSQVTLLTQYGPNEQKIVASESICGMV